MQVVPPLWFLLPGLLFCLHNPLRSTKEVVSLGENMGIRETNLLGLDSRAFLSQMVISWYGVNARHSVNKDWPWQTSPTYRYFGGFAGSKV